MSDASTIPSMPGDTAYKQIPVPTTGAPAGMGPPMHPYSYQPLPHNSNNASAAMGRPPFPPLPPPPYLMGRPYHPYRLPPLQPSNADDRSSGDSGGSGGRRRPKWHKRVTIAGCVFVSIILITGVSFGFGRMKNTREKMGAMINTLLYGKNKPHTGADDYNTASSSDDQAQNQSGQETTNTSNTNDDIQYRTEDNNENNNNVSNKKYGDLLDSGYQPPAFDDDTQLILGWNTERPTPSPTQNPTQHPTKSPTEKPSPHPTARPTAPPTARPKQTTSAPSIQIDQRNGFMGNDDHGGGYNSNYIVNDDDPFGLGGIESLMDDRVRVDDDAAKLCVGENCDDGIVASLLDDYGTLHKRIAMLLTG
jgi:hypothetical protein